ncbi:uncharacterized protein LOC115889879 [Sitophilus oryzae]|uniref:Uncharacterized protein LOC115889879 n=1 Tax=Sitophilus oryzae TaxID=7048 RepID=A0A6J2YP85_SITOR|nr:uncharacterized protein LOC115889879 [Sitophilus oryzae]
MIVIKNLSLYFVKSIVLLYFIKNCTAATRIMFKRCGLDGFTCKTNANKKSDIYYECPKTSTDILIYINQMGTATTTEKISINNCEKVTINMGCPKQNPYLLYLQITNVEKLSFLRTKVDSVVPPKVTLENITHIDTIPFHTFAQVDKTYSTASCTVPTTDFESLHIKNVNIDTVETGAFVGLNNFKNITLYNVSIKKIQTKGMSFRQNPLAEFEIMNSSINVIEDMGIQIYTDRAIISKNEFSEIYSSGINGSMKDFFFTNNSITTIHPYGISILATNTFILDNIFTYLKSYALEKISPGVLKVSEINLGKLKFIFDFSRNTISFADAGSLSPDYVSYENVKTEMVFSRNKFYCSCEYLGWLVSDLGHGPNTLQLDTFYKMVLNESSDNVCYQGCNLPVAVVKDMIQCGKCLKNVTIESLCLARLQIKVDVPTFEAESISTSTEYVTSFETEEAEDSTEQNDYTNQQTAQSSTSSTKTGNTFLGLTVVFLQYVIFNHKV